MPRTPSRCTKADIQRALRAIKAEDIRMSVEITREGIIRIVPVELPETLKRLPKSDARPIVL